MCYDVAYLTKKAENYAKKYGSKEDWEDIKKKLQATYHVSGFTQPKLPGITANHNHIIALNWPFFPFDLTPSAKDGRPLNTLNARDDKIFQKQSIYYQSALDRRCIIMLDGFYDHHIKNDIAYPHYIRFKSEEPMPVAGLWQTIKTPKEELNCTTLVTTQANKEMAWIHNVPAFSAESRMILVLPDRESMECWLYGSVDEAQQVIKPLPDNVLSYHSCRPLKSNKKLKRVYPGNVPEVQELIDYPELHQIQGSLF